MSVVDVVLEQLRTLDLSEGERLPSERDLAERCGISRSSVRNALKELQSRRVLSSRQGSGYFLSSGFAFQQALGGEDAEWSGSRIQQIFEAQGLVGAHVVASAVENIPPECLQELEDCLVELGRAVINADITRIEQLHHHFIGLILERAPNPQFIRMLNEVRVPSHYFSTVLQMAEGNERNGIFSEHVNLFQALKQRQQAQAQAVFLRLNRKIADLFEKYVEHILF